MESLATDVLVVGGGVGGLWTAVHAARSGASVTVLTGSGGASRRISSMITALGDGVDDDEAALFGEVWRAGHGLSNPVLLRALVGRIRDETRYLAELGVPFAMRDGRPARRQPVGSRYASAVFTDGMIGVDITRVAQRVLGQSAAGRIRLINGAKLYTIRTDESGVTGGFFHVQRSRSWGAIAARAVVLATGGSGRLFAGTTNPRGSLGTGIALALEAGCELVDMEFISHEPFVSDIDGDSTRRDLPTTVMYEGARLVNARGEEFIDFATYPTKDVICRRMLGEVAAGRGTARGTVYYDLSNMSDDALARYTQIAQTLAAPACAGRRVIEVAPTQHYMDGGVRVDGTGQSAVPGLFAVGEAAGGIHGAHRLAGAGGFEVIAGGVLVGESAGEFARARGSVPPAMGDPAPWASATDSFASDAVTDSLTRIRRALSEGCGVVRHGTRLQHAIDEVESVREAAMSNRDGVRARRASAVALSVLYPALARAESRGDHFRADHPRTRSEFDGNYTGRMGAGGEITIGYTRAAGRNVMTEDAW